MANEKIINLDNLKDFRQKNDQRYEEGKVEVGIAKQLKNISEESGSTQTAPFVFQATGTDDNTSETPTAPIAKHLQLRGNSVAWNQLQKISTKQTFTQSDVIFTNNNDGTWTLNGTASALIAVNLTDYDQRVYFIKGHKYYAKSLYENVGFYYNLTGFGTTSNSRIYEYTDNGEYSHLALYIAQGTSFTNAKVCIQLFDLTQLGKDYSSLLEFNRDYPLPYYSYNAGQLLSCKANKLITIGFNQFDEEIEGGYINEETGVAYSQANSFRTKNYIKVISGQTYTLSHTDIVLVSFYVYEYDGNYNFIKSSYVSYGTTSGDITLTNDTHYIKVACYKSNSGWGSNPPSQNDLQLCIYLTWDGSRTGYAPYEKHEYNLPSIELRSAGSVYDEITPDGTHTTRIGTYDLSLASWTYSSTRQYWETNSLQATIKKPSSNGAKANISCSNKLKNTADNVYLGQDGIGVSTGGTIYYHSTDSSNSPTGYLYYELATPTTEQVSSFTENIIVDDFGTMEFVSAFTESASNPIVPQGNQFFYPADYVLLIDDLNTYVDGDVNDLAKKTDIPYKELLSSYIGAITSIQITTNFYRNNIAVSGGLTNIKDARVLMSNGAIYPMIINGNELVVFNGTNFQTSSITVSKVYIKE